MACATYQLLIARVDYFILHEMISLGTSCKRSHDQIIMLNKNWNSAEDSSFLTPN